jgi:hypothetical protein
MLFASLEGWRHVEVTDRHAATDYAHLLRDVSDRWFPDAAKILWPRTISAPTNPLRSTRPSRPSRLAVR